MSKLRLGQFGGKIVVATVLAALAGCASIPTSGPVVAGPEIGLIEPDFVINPDGPREGASPTDILTGFMVAVRAPQGGYQVAREFMTTAMAQRWKPDAGALVRSTNSPSSVESSSADGNPQIEYTVETVADVDDRGRYRQTPETTRTLIFKFTRQAGQWRISEAPDGVVLSQPAFARAFTMAELYFVDPSGRFMVPELRWFALRSTTANKVVEELLVGPSDWLQQAVVNEFPTGTVLGAKGVEIRSGRAMVDLSAEAASATPQARAVMRMQLLATLGVTDVGMSAGGAPLDVPPLNPGPLVDPQPSGTVLIGSAAEFGFGTDKGLVEIPGITHFLVNDRATGATLAHDQASVAYLAQDGSVKYADLTRNEPETLDSRKNLLPPSLDPFGFLWVAQREAGPAIWVLPIEGQPISIAPADLPADLSIASIDVSRDGTRLLLTASSVLGSRILVYGIVRAEGIPTTLNGPLELPAPASGVLDATWVDDQSVAVLAGTGDRVVHMPLGGPSSELPGLALAVQIVGGRGGVIGVRALAGGRVYAAGAGGGWIDTGLTADYLATQQ